MTGVGGLRSEKSAKNGMILAGEQSMHYVEWPEVGIRSSFLSEKRNAAPQNKNIKIPLLLIP